MKTEEILSRFDDGTLSHGEAAAELRQVGGFAGDIDTTLDAMRRMKTEDEALVDRIMGLRARQATAREFRIELGADYAHALDLMRRASERLSEKRK